MKKILSILYCTLFFGICVFFSAGLLLPQTKAAEVTESKGEMPKLKTDDGINGHFGNEFEEWFSKNFAFRDTVVDVYSSLRMNLFSEGNDQVVVGRDGFLFFSDTVDDYIGTSAMTDDEIEKAAAALKYIQEKTEESGGAFLFVCAPNKNTIYGGYMPLRYKKSESPSNLDRLYKALDESGVSYIDLRPTLTERAEQTLVYHKRDTHWNGAGAEAAFVQTASFFGVTLPDLSDRGPVVVDDFEGDLEALMFPGEIKYDSDITYDFEGLYVFTSAYSTPMDIVITARGGGEKKLLMYRDSFANALIPYAASSFAEIRLERAVPHRTEYIESMSPDCVVVEIAERNLPSLARSVGLPE